jgi:hypothetical protein
MTQTGLSHYDWFMRKEGFDIYLKPAKYGNRRIRLTQVTTTYRIRGYGSLPQEFNGF